MWCSSRGPFNLLKITWDQIPKKSHLSFHTNIWIAYQTLKLSLCFGLWFSGFEHPITACCGYGGPPLNYDSRISCGQTKNLNGSLVTAIGCNDTTEYINWDGIHYTEAANLYVSSQILTGKYSDPPFSDKMPFLLKFKFYWPTVLIFILSGVWILIILSILLNTQYL